MKLKYLLPIITASLLTGCVNPMFSNPVSDYSIFCPTVQQSDEGKVVVIKEDQRDFYITSDGAMYSQRELSALNTNSTALAGTVNSIVGNVVGNVIPEKSDPATAKKVIVRKFVYDNDRAKSYCGSVFTEDDKGNVKDGDRFLLDTSQITLDNKSVYERENKQVYLKRIK